MSDTLLQVRDLATHFSTRGGLAKAVDGVSFDVAAGEIVGLVGESGSGKSVTGYSILGLIDPPGRIAAGSVRLDGEELIGMPHARLRTLRGRRVAMVFQDPMSTLNAVLKVSAQMQLAMLAHGKPSAGEMQQRSLAALARVGIPDPEQRLNAYPHELSGGMRQRVAIARALAMRPDALVCDEPVASLDVSIQAQIINLFLQLRRDLNLTMLFISHDLSVVRHVSDRVAMMYLGRIVETGRTEDIFESPRHPYTRALLDSAPRLAADGAPAQDIRPIRGELPSPINPPSGCAFHQRCAYAQERCKKELPVLRPSGDQREAACHFPLGDKADD